jgi:hypothetical protein
VPWALRPAAAGTTVTDASVEDVAECVDLAEASCGDLNSVQPFDRDSNP